MPRKFKALCDFKSREFNGTQYAKGLTYTIRDGNKKLQNMAARWLKATLFTVNEDLEMFGATFKAGTTSYCIDDAFSGVVDSWVTAGKATYVEGSLITFDFDDAPAGVVTGG
ncbi:MAG: hypothetical protein GQ532_14960 [Methylomarinum sp.]|nr:hypothetical protein [Methylomarinum sp.]